MGRAVLKHKGNLKQPNPARATRASAFSSAKASTNPDRKAKDKHGYMRSKSKIKILNMYTKKPDEKKMREKPNAPVRIEPDRRWFGNTRVISQDKLQLFREEAGNVANDTFKMMVKSPKLPISLILKNPQNKSQRLLEIESYESTFGPKNIRKRPKLQEHSLHDLAASAVKKSAEFDEKILPYTNATRETDNETQNEIDDSFSKDQAAQEIFNKGTSRRIWTELYKVIDSSDILLQVLDVRDPQGCRCKYIENYIKTEKKYKKMVFLLNKCDLVPTYIASKWVRILNKEYPTVAFHASIEKPFGKNTLFQLLRQFSSILKDKKYVSVGLIGYPNVGKSSVINTLTRKKVCKTAPIPGETRVWQYVSLTKRIHLIDSPGVVPSDKNAKADSTRLLRGTVRPERVDSPETFIPDIIAKVAKSVIDKTYSLGINDNWDTAEELLNILAAKWGRLLKGGLPDCSTVARTVLYDWQRGRIPYYTAPTETQAAIPS